MPTLQECALEKFYRPFLQQLDKNEALSAGWYSKDRQDVRFYILSKIGDLRQKAVLDVGCGTASLYDFLKKCSAEVSYTGIEYLPHFIAKAKSKFPQITLLQDNFLKHDFKDSKYDFVLASGLFPIKYFNYWNNVKKIIKKMFYLSRKGTAFNLLSRDALKKEKGLVYYDPLKVIKFCKTLTNFVVFRQDYLENDFTIYMYH